MPPGCAAVDAAAPPGSMAMAPVVAERPGRLVAVSGPLDERGIEQLAGQLSAVLADGTAFLGVDLSGVTTCEVRLFAMLDQVHTRLRDRAGSMRLLGMSPAVLAALEHAPIREVLTVYTTSDWRPGSNNGPDEALPSEKYLPASTGPTYACSTCDRPEGGRSAQRT